MKNIDNFISLGQDCSTFLFITQTNKHKAGFFDRFAIYSSDYLKFFDKEFLLKNKNNIQVYCKSSIQHLLKIFSLIKNKQIHKKMRLHFLIIYGDKYDNGLIDVIHVDNTILYNLVQSNNLQSFLLKIEQNVIPHIKDRIIRNIENHLKLFDNPDNKNLFVRTIKHHMSEKEAIDLKQLNSIILQKFKNSKLLVITDVNDNLAYKLDFVKFLSFDHWKSNEIAIASFNKIVEEF